jgi:energy-coupling factor transporter ATP-binding protein EcfA2
MVFQRPEIQLFCSTVWEDVAVAPRLQGVAGQELARRVEWALDAVGLDPETFGGRGPYSLSVGEQRRVALAGILSLAPEVLVLDEPGSGLDPAARHRLMALLVDWARGTVAPGATGEARTLVFTSHDLDEVSVTADRVVVLHEGRLETEGPADAVLGDEELLSRVGLRPTLASRVALRMGAGGGVLPASNASLALWLESRIPA